jgi:maltooligosyltrehalose trehalohydrolase
VVCAQNHDQVGNRMLGDRLSSSSPSRAEARRRGGAALALRALLFMGEEYGETAPFPYFVSHSDPALVDAVREGRRREFAAFRWAGVPPDPESLANLLPRPASSAAARRAAGPSAARFLR